MTRRNAKRRAVKRCRFQLLAKDGRVFLKTLPAEPPQHRGSVCRAKVEPWLAEKIALVLAIVGEQSPSGGISRGCLVNLMEGVLPSSGPEYRSKRRLRRAVAAMRTEGTIQGTPACLWSRDHQLYLPQESKKNRVQAGRSVPSLCGTVNGAKLVNAA